MEILFLMKSKIRRRCKRSFKTVKKRFKRVKEELGDVDDVPIKEVGKQSKDVVKGGKKRFTQEKVENLELRNKEIHFEYQTINY